MITATYTSRGFVSNTFEDSYGQKCSLQESSNVVPHIWLGVDIDLNGNEVHTRMHLSTQQVAELLPKLLYFAETGGLPDP